MSIAAKKEAILAEKWYLGQEPFLMSLSLLSGWCLFGRPGAVNGAPLFAAKRTLDSEDRSGTMGQEGKASEPSVKGGSAKMAPSRAALNNFQMP